MEVYRKGTDELQSKKLDKAYYVQTNSAGCIEWTESLYQVYTHLQ